MDKFSPNRQVWWHVAQLITAALIVCDVLVVFLTILVIFSLRLRGIIKQSEKPRQSLHRARYGQLF